MGQPVRSKLENEIYVREKEILIGIEMIQQIKVTIIEINSILIPRVVEEQAIIQLYITCPPLMSGPLFLLLPDLIEEIR